MKETIKINLAQRLFDLDEDAYKKLKEYLDSLRDYFIRSSEETEEILSDIEQRIAELLLDRLKDKKQVVTLKDIDYIVEMMGTVDDFAREAETSENSNPGEEKRQKSYSTYDYSKEHRRLFRDVDENILGGVCSGLAAYFNTEAVWIRLAFIVLFFMNLIGFILYIILWIVVPPAVTTAQKLQMRGKPVNIGNIQDSVKSEFGKVKDNFNRFTESESFRKSKDVAGEAARAIGNGFLFLFKILLIIIGAGLAVAGLALLISLLAAIAAGGFWHGWHIPDLAITEHMTHFFQNMTLFSMAVFLVIAIPVIAIFAGIIRLLFNLKKGNSILAAFGWTIWSLALVFVIITLILGIDKLSLGFSYKDVKNLNTSDYKILYLRLDEEGNHGDRMEYFSVFGKDIVKDEWNDDFLLEPEICIKPSDDRYARLQVNYASLVPWDDHYDFNPYHFTFRDSLLILDNYWRVDEDDLWRLPKVKLTLYLPENQHIRIDRDFKTIPTGENGYSSWPDWYYTDELIMLKEGLQKN